MPLVVLTGATSGIGRAAAIELVRRGADVAIVGRDGARVQATGRAAGATTHGYVADLEQMGEVRGLAHELLERHARIDVLVNNAGAMFTAREETPDGFERTLALNHLAPFLLTALLLERLRASAPARIVTTASGAHTNGTLDVDDLQSEHSFTPMGAYATMKLCNVLFTRSLARGARSLVWLALSEESAGLSGVYVHDEQVVAPSRAAQDSRLAAALWTRSAALVS